MFLDRQILQVAGRLEESQRILDNNPAAGLAGAIAKAWELYASERWGYISVWNQATMAFRRAHTSAKAQQSP